MCVCVHVRVCVCVCVCMGRSGDDKREVMQNKRTADDSRCTFSFSPSFFFGIGRFSLTLRVARGTESE